MITRTPRALLAATLALGVVATGCTASSTTITSTGRVQSDTVTAQVPTLTVPAVDLDAGFAPTTLTGSSASTGAAGATANLSTVPSLLGLGAAPRVAAVRVRIGDRVEAGQVLVRFDAAALSANLATARADLAVARAQVGVLDSAIDTTRDKQAELVDKRREIRAGIAKATSARSQLVAKLAAAVKVRKDLSSKLTSVTRARTGLTGKRAQADAAAKTLRGRLATVNRNLATAIAKRAELAAQLARVEAALAALPPEAPPEVRDPLVAAQRQLTAALAELDAGIAQLKSARGLLTAGLAKVEAGRTKLSAALRQLGAGVARLRAGIRQLDAGIPRLGKAIATVDVNLARARDGLTQLTKGIARLKDVRAGLQRTRALAVIAAADDTAVRRARVAHNEATVTAPRDGIVTSVVHVGDTLAPGATVAELRSPAHVVELWLPPDQAHRVCLGDAATLAWGDNPGGRVSRILPLAQYPPTFHTTDEVHLTRAVPVEVRFDTALPPGVPVDVRLVPCRTNEVNP